MSNEAQQLTSALEQWEAQYLAARESLNLQDLHALLTLLARLVKQVERDATGPSSLVTPPSK
jgi:hypothetical protein